VPDAGRKREVNGHVDIERLLEVAHGTAGGPETDAIVGHCLACRECGDLLWAMLALKLGGKKRRSQRRRVALIAASIAVVAALTGLLWWSAARGGGPPAPTAASDPALAPAPSIDAGPAPGLASLATTAPPDRKLLDFLFGDTPVTPTATNVPAERAGLELVITGRYPEAVELFRGQLAARPQDPRLSAFLGVARYLSGDTDPEVEAQLTRGAGASPEALARLSTWYLANHHLRRNDREAAEAFLRGLAAQEDEFGLAAARLLERLAANRIP
jgi:hypothetical protein